MLKKNHFIKKISKKHSCFQHWSLTLKLGLSLSL